MLICWRLFAVENKGDRFIFEENRYVPLFPAGKKYSCLKNILNKLKNVGSLCGQDLALLLLAYCFFGAEVGPSLLHLSDLDSRLFLSPFFVVMRGSRLRSELESFSNGFLSFVSGR